MSKPSPELKADVYLCVSAIAGELGIAVDDLPPSVPDLIMKLALSVEASTKRSVVSTVRPPPPPPPRKGGTWPKFSLPPEPEIPEPGRLPKGISPLDDSDE